MTWAQPHNTVTLTGNLADDPDLRFTPAGVAVTNLRLAVNSRRFDKNTNEWEDDTDGFWNVSVWRDMAENVAESVHKGDRITVVGRIRSRSYENKEGQTVWVTEVVADEVSASMRWATVAITRTGGRGGGAGHPAARADEYGQGSGGADVPPPPTDDDVPF